MDRLREWLAAHGGAFHPRAVLDQGPYGVGVFAPRIVADTTVVECPLDLVVTKDGAGEALRTILGDVLDGWSERQLIVSYLCFHHICPSRYPEVLRHLPYIECLPPAEKLSTSLHFTTAELELLRGTNLYGATLDRERDWQTDWAQCRDRVQTVHPAWADAFTWAQYKSAATHLSSRAFPSSILSPTPSLTAPSYPVLIPGVDCLNHKRRQPVSWVTDSTAETIALVAHPQPRSDTGPPDALAEVFNNYGPKPNDELILGYGFSIANNPDDSMTLQIGGSAKKWAVGRRACGVDGLWDEVSARIAGGNEHAFEDELDTAGVLMDMVEAKLDGMKTVADVWRCDQVRPAVRVMLEDYIRGQRDILESILEFAKEKQGVAVESAREQGIDLVFEDDED